MFEIRFWGISLWIFLLMGCAQITLENHTSETFPRMQVGSPPPPVPDVSIEMSNLILEDESGNYRFIARLKKRAGFSPPGTPGSPVLYIKSPEPGNDIQHNMTSVGLGIWRFDLTNASDLCKDKYDYYFKVNPSGSWNGDRLPRDEGNYSTVTVRGFGSLVWFERGRSVNSFDQQNSPLSIGQSGEMGVAELYIRNLKGIPITISDASITNNESGYFRINPSTITSTTLQCGETLNFKVEFSGGGNQSNANLVLNTSDGPKTIVLNGFQISG